MSLERELRRQLRKNQSRRRYRHGLAVSRLAAELGRLHGWKPREAALAGLLHDWAKEWRPGELVDHVRRHRVKVPGLSLIVRHSPNVLHGYVAADIARRERWLNARAAAAVAAHTLGSERMTIEDRILYVADFAAYGRPYPEAKAVRRLARRDLDAAFRAAVADKLIDVISRGKPLHPLTLRVWDRLTRSARPR